MKLHAVISGPAQRDAADIASYIDAAAGPEVADRVLRSISTAIAKLARTPTLGHPKDELLPPAYRFYFARPYYIVYRVLERRLEVLRIIHAARDLAAILAPDTPSS